MHGAMSATTDLTANLDERCWSARDLLGLIAAAREARVRDPLGYISDAVLDMVGGA